MSSDRPFKDNVIFTEEMANAARTRLREKLASMKGDEAVYAAEGTKEDQPMSFDDEDEEACIEDEEACIDDLLPFTLEEKDLIEQMGATLRERMVWVDPATLRKLATFLYAFERLPYATPGLSLDPAIMDRIDESLCYVSVELDEQSFRLSTGGSVYSPDVGSDSFSKTLFEIETGGFRDGSTEAFIYWLDAFISASGAIEIQGDDEADLNEPAPEDGWDRLAKYWESHGEDAGGW